MPKVPKLTTEEFDSGILESVAKPNRVMAPVWYYGGKGNMAGKIVPLIPEGNVYVEPYCGAASIFWRLPPREVEVLNDIYEEIINLFRVLQDSKTFAELRHRLIWTPYSISEFRRALSIGRGEGDSSQVDMAWAFFVRQGQGFNGLSGTEGNWSRVFVSSRDMAKTASSWRGRMKNLDFWHNRLTRVQLDCRDALEVIRYWDSPDTVFYCDPPYVPGTRKSKNVYAHEVDLDHHRKLVSTLLKVKGKVLLSGYGHLVYWPLQKAGWKKINFQTACHAANKGRGTKLRGKGAVTEHVPRTEVLWIKD